MCSAWDFVYAYNEEALGPNGTCCSNQGEVVLTRYLLRALEKLNPDLPADAYDQAIRRIVETSAVQVPRPDQPREVRPLQERRARDGEAAGWRRRGPAAPGL